jgi:hypothetical protein
MALDRYFSSRSSDVCLGNLAQGLGGPACNLASVGYVKRVSDDLDMPTRPWPERAAVDKASLTHDNVFRRQIDVARRSTSRAAEEVSMKEKPVIVKLPESVTVRPPGWNGPKLS